MNAQTLAYAPADLSFEDTAVAFSSMSDAELLALIGPGAAACGVSV